MSGRGPLVSLDEARSVVGASCRRLDPREMTVGEAVGCVLAEDVVAQIDLPPFTNSAMDGYALRAGDVAQIPAALEVVASIMAGSGDEISIGRGQAARIMTGAPLPSGADAVCKVEDTRTSEDGTRVVVEAPVRRGENVRLAGDDLHAGEVVLRSGDLVGPAALAALVACGVAEVTAHPRPRVGVISTGDELVEGGSPLARGQIHDSNRPMLLAMVAETGCDGVDLGHARDEAEDLTRVIEEAIGDLDALVLSGGVSVGDVDLVRVVLEKLGGSTARWMQIAIKPAKPFAFALLGGRTPAFGLPGNPVSAAVSFELLVRPSIRAIAGRSGSGRPVIGAKAAQDLTRSADGKTHYLRVRLEPDTTVPGGGWTAVTLKGQGSHQIGSFAQAQGLAVLPDGEGARAGEIVQVIVVDPESLGTQVLALSTTEAS